MDTVLEIILFICLIALVAIHYLRERNRRVCEFLLRLADMSYKSSLIYLRSGNIEDLEKRSAILEKLIESLGLTDYSKYLYSFKKLTLESFFGKDEILFLEKGVVSEELYKKLS